MPIRIAPDSDARYYLLSFDERGNEHRERDSSFLSHAVAAELRSSPEPITDIFFTSHGWKGDVPAAIAQYDRWVKEMVRSPDYAAASTVRPGFNAIVVGLHWPSLPFGDEKLPAASKLLSREADEVLARHEDVYAASIGDTPSARNAIRTILVAAQRDDASHESLPSDVRLAYEALYLEVLPRGVGRGSLGEPPGADQGNWDADEIYRGARERVADAVAPARPGVLGNGVLNGTANLILAPLQQLSFYKMKNRAREIGESGGHTLLKDLQRAAPNARIHLMGHSFGCIVVSAAVAGDPTRAGLNRPAHSLSLVQGALSLWSYSPDIPIEPGAQGFFSRILKNRLVTGPIITTHSSLDFAVGRFYPHAARLAGQYLLDGIQPRYGGMGTFGARGLADRATEIAMRGANYTYRFENNRVYNLDASATIKNGDGISGAHSDIAHPEVAHAIWQAALA